MKVNDLRIGNLVYYRINDNRDERKEWDEVNKIDIADLNMLSDNPDYHRYKAIPLTEEWLLKFGLLKFGIIYEQEKDSQFAVKNWEGKEWLVFWGDSRLVKINIKYVHQLQNLYFTLIGQELTINL